VAGYVAGHFTWPHPAPPPPTELVVTDAALPAGIKLTPADLRTVSVQPGAKGPAGSMTPAAAGGLVGLVTARAIPAGTFLERSLLTNAGALPNNAHALVGLALKPGQLPVGGLSVGQQVLVVTLRTSSDGTVLRPVPLVITRVWDMQGPDSSGATLATVLVPAHEAALLSGYAAQGDVALVATAVTNLPRLSAPSVTPTLTPKPTPKPTAKPTKAAPHPSKTSNAKKTGR
jgi:hypothetical protein